MYPVWIINVARRVCTRTGILLLAIALSAPLQSEEGQYRSRILIDPAGALEKGTAQSVEQLEQQLDSLTDPYAIASTTRHLARQYIELRQYDKAIAYYRAALDAEGLSDIADRELLRELARVYLLNEDYGSAAGALENVLQFNLVPEAADYLLLARAWFRSGDYVAAVATLDQLMDSDLSLDNMQLRHVLALYYQAGAYSQCSGLLQELLERDPDNPEYWHQLTAIYLLQDKRREALNQLTLAYEKGVSFREQDIFLLADLFAVNDNPHSAARVLQEALEKQVIAGSGEHFRKQFEFWLQAREKDRAITALGHAASLTGDTELYLYLAQLFSEKENWQAMQDTVLAACSSELEDRYVSRANFLLGVSQLKLGDPTGARRSFINATLIGGDSGQAAQWLRFMEADPPTDSESKRIVSPCYGSQDKQRGLSVAQDDHQPAVSSSPMVEDKAEELNVVVTKTVPRQRLFTVKHNMTPASMAAKTKALATRLAIKLIQAGGEIDGPLQVLLDTAPTGPNEARDFQLAFPTRGSPRASGRYRMHSTDSFRCSYLIYTGATDGIPAAWAELARSTREGGYRLTGHARYVFSAIGETSPTGGTVELQLGIE